MDFISLLAPSDSCPCSVNSLCICIWRPWTVTGQYWVAACPQMTSASTGETGVGYGTHKESYPMYGMVASPVVKPVVSRSLNQGN